MTKIYIIVHDDYDGGPIGVTLDKEYADKFALFHNGRVDEWEELPIYKNVIENTQGLKGFRVTIDTNGEIESISVHKPIGDIVNSISAYRMGGEKHPDWGWKIYYIGLMAKDVKHAEEIAREFKYIFDKSNLPDGEYMIKDGKVYELDIGDPMNIIVGTTIGRNIGT